MINGLRMPRINGVYVGWSQVSVLISGVPVTGITAIEYDDKQTMEKIYGAGQTPIGVGYGNIECSGSITLLFEELEALRQSSVTKRLQDIAPFDIVVAYLPVGGSVVANHVLRNCQFMENGVSTKIGDTKNERTIPLLITHIDF